MYRYVEDGLDVKRLLLGKYEGFVSVITDNVQRQQLVRRMYHFLPKQFRHHFIGRGWIPLFTASLLCVKTSVDDSQHGPRNRQYGPCNQSSDTRE